MTLESLSRWAWPAWGEIIYNAPTSTICSLRFWVSREHCAKAPCRILEIRCRTDKHPCVGKVPGQCKQKENALTGLLLHSHGVQVMVRVSSTRRGEMPTSSSITHSLCFLRLTQKRQVRFCKSVQWEPVTKRFSGCPFSLYCKWCKSWMVR